MSLKTTRQLQHKHLSFQKITPCQNAPEQNPLPWFEVEAAAAAATVVREQVFLERWQLGCQTLMLNYTMLVCYSRDVISNYSYIIIYGAAKVLSERQDKGLEVCTGSIDAGGFPSNGVKSIFSLVIWGSISLNICHGKEISTNGISKAELSPAWEKQAS